MLKYRSSSDFTSLKVSISGSGNVAQYAALKAISLGATILSLSDSKGALISTDPAGITANMIEIIAALKVKRGYLSSIASTADFSSKVKYIDGARPWTHVGDVDVALPCATQNEVSGEEAEALIKQGVKFVAEGSNMGCTQEAIDVFESHRKSNSKADAVWYAPGKAANCGGVAVSGLEMAQNSQRIKWTSEEVDGKLKGIMANCFKVGVETAKTYCEKAGGELPSLVAGSNVAGFMKVAEAMREEGDWW